MNSRAVTWADVCWAVIAVTLVLIFIFGIDVSGN
jgi:hypothetical protein